MDLPPIFISPGAIDLLLQETIEFARQLTRAGVPVDLRVDPGASRGFRLLAAAARLSKIAGRDSRQARHPAA